MFPLSLLIVAKALSACSMSLLWGLFVFHWIRSFIELLFSSLPVKVRNLRVACTALLMVLFATIPLLFLESDMSLRYSCMAGSSWSVWLMVTSSSVPPAVCLIRL